MSYAGPGSSAVGTMRPSAYLLAVVTLFAGVARADALTFDEFYRQVSECRLELSRYADVLQPTRDGILISLPSAGALRGFLIDSLYVAEGPLGAEEYGLLINGPVTAVGRAFPEWAGRRTVNGHLRRLTSLAEHSRARGAGRKTLLVCTSGTSV